MQLRQVESNEADSSETPINNSPEYSFSANSGALRHIGHSKPVVTSPEVLNKSAQCLGFFDENNKKQ
jgi:hypothetical protein